MKKQEFALILLRLLALYTVATSISSLFNAVLYLTGIFAMTRRTGLSLGVALSLLVPFVLQVGFGLLLWILSVTLSQVMTDKMSDEPISQWQPRQMTQVALCLMGVLMVSRGIGDTGQVFVRYGLNGAASSTATFMSLAVSSFSGFPILLIGLVLIFGARFWSYWLSPHDNGYLTEPQSAAAALNHQELQEHHD